MKPPKSILDRSFPYVSSARTDIAKTFRRIIKQQAAERAALEAEKVNKVTPIRGMK